MRSLFTGLLSMAACCAWAQPASSFAGAAKEAPAGRACGSVVIVHCPASAARGAKRGAPAQWEATRWAESSGDNQIVITGDRIRIDPIGTVFQRNLASSGSESGDLPTTDRGAGVRCTVTRTGQIYCSRAADATPGAVGVQTDWSDWSF